MSKTELPKRKHPRLKQYDYSSNGFYFVTICCKDKQCSLSKIEHFPDVVGHCLAPHERLYADTILTLSSFGQIAEKQLLELEIRYDYVKIDKYVIMPNHIHAIIILEGAAGASPRPTLTDIICTYKSLTTRECNAVNKTMGRKLFQTSFFDHIISNEVEYQNVWQYINENPRKWGNDEYYI